MTTQTRRILAFSVLGAVCATSAWAQEPACPFYENRSGLCGY